MKIQLVALATLLNFCALARPGHWGPIASVAPASVTFITQSEGTTSPAQTITLTNRGTVPLSINEISISGADARGFGYTTACGSNLAVGASCAINLNFTPTLVGTETATLVISDNSSLGGTQSVALSGTGQALSSHSVTLSWEPSATPDVTSYDVYRCPGSGCKLNQNIGSVPVGTNSLTDTSVTKGATYTYAVSALDDSGESALSITTTAVIPN